MALDTDRRVELWSRALGAVRAYFAGQGLREVTTPVKLPEVALEPFIEPLPCADGWLATSPELPMKRLLAAGSGPIYQIAPVFRRHEHGDRHTEEFRLVEWYRLGPDLAPVRRDVEQLVAAVLAAVGDVVRPPRPPPVWQTHRWLDVFAQTTGVDLRGDESAEELADRLRDRGSDPWVAAPGLDRLGSPRARALLAWTAVFSSWADRALDRWLAARPAAHLVEFPRALAALARPIDACVADRFESHVGDLELANGYGELTCPDEQSARFEAVAELRAALGQPPLPSPRAFMAALRAPGLPPCSGAALGLDRLVMLACGARSLADVGLA
jgi:elongation factor P--(R)-beta-lysine ligase